MTPAARYAAAIAVLDPILAGSSAEKELTSWARSNRYAGSKDRAAVRDIVFDCLRNLRVYRHRSGLPNARGVVVGHVIKADIALRDVFNAVGYAPSVLSAEELDEIDAPKPEITVAEQLNISDWLADLVDDQVGSEIALQSERAPIDLRVNLAKTTLNIAKSALSKDGIETDFVPDSATALRVQGETRKIPQTKLYQDGLIELQDAGSQALVAELGIVGAAEVLDYCAGGGGKSLAISALYDQTRVSAFDIVAGRMADLPDRAKRAGTSIKVLKNDPVNQSKTYDLVILDVPCTGSGSWRRAPDGKWKLTPTRFDELLGVQAQILENAKQLVKTDGKIAYMTCSLFSQENEKQIQNFLDMNPNWLSKKQWRTSPSSGTDGFFLCILER